MTNQGPRVHFGMYENDMQNGLGISILPDDSKYIGEWWGSVRNGLGMYYDSKSNEIFNGQWNMGNKGKGDIISIKDGKAIKKEEPTYQKRYGAGVRIPKKVDPKDQANI